MERSLVAPPPPPEVDGARGDPGTGSSSAVTCRGVTRRFGAVVAVDAVDLDVAPGELLALLGPSGCGKTTTLRLVAGFERPDAGTVAIAGEEVAGARRFVPPERRRVGVVFQDHALFPHLDVARNVGYGVRDRARRRRRVAEMLDLVGLAEYARRRPHELSGGQQQRVALARALAPEPAIVLLDEPFSNLDTALRVRVRAEVRAILRAADATAVFVTHDQEEALSLADRIAVMRDGRILQTAPPDVLYAEPADAFVASFVGDAELLPGHAAAGKVETEIGALPVQDPVQGPVLAMLRPESVRFQLDGFGLGVVSAIEHFGHDQVVEVRLPTGARVRSRTGPRKVLEPGDRVSVAVAGAVRTFPRTG